MDESVSVSEITEYEQLKCEQRDRMRTRDNLIYVTFAALGASAVGAAHTSPALLLGMPLVCYALGWTYLRNNHKIAMIGRYLGRFEFADWERHRIHEPGRRRRKLIELSVNYCVFIVTGLAALGAFWSNGRHPVWLEMASGAEVFLILLLAVEFARHSDIPFFTTP